LFKDTLEAWASIFDLLSSVKDSFVVTLGELDVWPEFDVSKMQDDSEELDVEFSEDFDNAYERDESLRSSLKTSAFSCSSSSAGFGASTE